MQSVRRPTTRWSMGRFLQILTAAGDLLSNGLTNEQARVIATDEDVTLVLAGAGTGKTAVTIGKIAYLARNQGVEAEKIPTLAFNRKAAQGGDLSGHFGFVADLSAAVIPRRGDGCTCCPRHRCRITHMHRFKRLADSGLGYPCNCSELSGSSFAMRPKTAETSSVPAQPDRRQR